MIGWRLGWDEMRQDDMIQGYAGMSQHDLMNTWECMHGQMSTCIGWDGTEWNGMGWMGLLRWISRMHERDYSLSYTTRHEKLTRLALHGTGVWHGMAWHIMELEFEDREEASLCVSV